MKHSCPPPRWAATRWLSAPKDDGDGDGEVSAELRDGIFRRTDSLLMSAVITMLITIFCYCQHPTRTFLVWTIVDLTFNIARIGVVFGIIRSLKADRSGKTQSAWVIDWFVTIGTTWCLLVGIATGLYVSTGDPALNMLGTLLAMGTAGGQCARNTAAPRLTRLQMLLIVIPFAIGASLSPFVMVHWVALLAPIYALGMMGISRELHADYVVMIMARLETRRAAMHCSLTGLPNRSFFQETVVDALRVANASGRALTLACLDLDGFKAVNDDLGHPMGDALLKLVAERIAHLAPAATMCARLGGDEFAILLPSDDCPRAERMARRIIEGIAAPFALSGHHKAQIGISIGLATSRGLDSKSFDQLLKSADQALYAAKRGGRGTFRWYGEPLERVRIDGLRETDLASAVGKAA